MKQTYQEYIRDMPPVVMWIKAAAITGQPIGISTYQEAIEKYPEYFKEEVEYQRKRALVPKIVDDAYDKEYEQLKKKCYKDVPPSKGISGWEFFTEEGQKEYRIFNEVLEKANKKFEPLKKQLHKKHYAKYGL